MGFAVAAALAGGWLLLKRAPAAALAAACGFGVLAHAALFGGLAPSLTPSGPRATWPTTCAGRVWTRRPRGPVAYVGYAEPSAVFLDGARTEINATAQGGADAIAEGRPVVVDARQDAAFQLALAAKGVAGPAGRGGAGLQLLQGPADHAHDLPAGGAVTAILPRRGRMGPGRPKATGRIG